MQFLLRKLSVCYFPCVCVLFCTSTEQAVLKLPSNVTIPAVFAFGDSILDAGNNDYITTLVKCNFPPYGRDFFGGRASGRFSNGKVPSDIMVEELRIKQLLPAYLDPNLKAADLLTGVNFASGGAGYDSLTSELVSAISLRDQLDMFKQYKVKLKEVVGEARASTILTNSLFLVVAGSDDIANTYFSTPVRRLVYDIPSYTDLMAHSAFAFLQELFELGARRIGVVGVPPVGCLPSQRTLAGGANRHCAEQYNQAAELFNTKLLALLDFLNKILPQTKVAYADVYSPMLDIIQNPHKSGFEVVNRGCCGTGTFEVAFMCNELDVLTCANVSEYLFWDSYHPTERAYRIITHQLGQQLMDGLFCGGRPC
ncbi:GDSL esterase/lipase EXL3-like [Malania oleifera]|uniref:GDSL esterase/lipase EXL3-like n=1 Tax=Malania oleifera TaxID=397392 RepID=UPI0025AE0B01|nr:GDSL esterase/lipase EXL3-like [Malania oleifera]